MASFVHLHTHSSYSAMQGVPSLDGLCAAARAQGSDHLALTDTNGLYGAIRFVQTARQHGLAPILGAEVIKGCRRAVLLAKSPAGYANLCRILSARHTDPSCDLIALIARHRDGVIVLSDDAAALTAWQRAGEHDLYVELTPGPAMAGLVTVARRTGLPPVATARAYLLHPDDFPLHRLLRAIALNTTLSRLPGDATCARTHWLMPPALLARQFPHVPDALANTRRIAEACHTDWTFKDTIFPAFRELADADAFELLRDKTYAGAATRYGVVTPAVTQRIEAELAVIREKRYANYFLVVDEIVRRAPRTCGRGSVAASIVSYCLGITHVEPLRHHLFFERFLNPGRQDPPDIDIDFPWDERDEIVDWVFATYGDRRAAMVANQNGMELRGALREVAKVFGMAPDEIGRVGPLLQRQKEFLTFETIPSADLWAARLSRSLSLAAPWPEIVRFAVRLIGHFRHLSLHCGGIVIVPDDIRRYVPVERAAKGVPVIQWEKDQTEAAGLVKIDLLGNRSLAVIRDALAAIARHTGRTIDYAAWDPLHDPATQELIRRADTIGCFYIESPATRLLLRKLWGGMPPARRAAADLFEELVVVSSLVRPAANPFIEDYIRRAHGAPHRPLHPIVEDVLAETHGIMVYQEDVTKVAMALADFSIEDADQLRKVISKKHKERQLQDYRVQFYRGALAKGTTPAALETLWAMIMSFAGYSFCKPHSASYAQVSFKCAWLRAHYPAEFMAAVISNEGGFYSTFAYLSEARRMALTILPPDVNASDWAYAGSGRTIRMGLMQLKGFPKAAAERLFEARVAGGLFRSFQDLLGRVKLETAHARTLIRAGCCDSIAGELTRPALLWRLHAAGRHDGRPLPVPDEYAPARRLAHEIETLGLIWSRHPLTLCRDYIRSLRPPPIAARELDRHINRRVRLLGWLTTEKIVEAKDGRPMEFVTFEDTTALYDATLFPDVYRRYCHLLGPNRGFVVDGVVEERFGAVTVTVERLQTLEGRMQYVEACPAS